MNCPNCDCEMKHTYKEWWGFSFSTGIEPDYPSLFCHDEYSCAKCKIKYINGKWDIPDKFLPTEKQKKTILFINNHLNMDLEAITKHQCWIDIGKYFEEAKNTQLHTDEWYEDLQECFSEADFF